MTFGDGRGSFFTLPQARVPEGPRGQAPAAGTIAAPLPSLSVLQG